MITIGCVRSRTVPAQVAILAAQSDIDAAGDVPLGVLCRIAHIQNLRSCIAQAQNLLEFHRLQHLFERLVQRGPLARVEDGVEREVRRRVRLIGGDKSREFLLRHRLQCVVEAPLIAQRRHRIRGKILAAQRARAVRRVHERLIRQRQQLVVQRIVQMAAQFFGRPTQRSAQIRPPHVADEQRVAGQHRIGLRPRSSRGRRPEWRWTQSCAPASPAPEPQPWELKVSPSFIGTNAYSACARAPSRMSAPQRSRNSRCPATKSAWKWVRKTWRICDAELLGVAQVLADVALRIDDNGRQPMASSANR